MFFELKVVFFFQILFTSSLNLKNKTQSKIREYVIYNNTTTKIDTIE